MEVVEASKNEKKKLLLEKILKNNKCGEQTSEENESYYSESYSQFSKYKFSDDEK